MTSVEDTDGRDDVSALLLRPATPDDVAVADVHLAARRAAPMPAHVHGDDDVRAWLVGRLTSDDELWVAEVGGAVVGYARVVEAWLDDLYVHPDHAGRGVGTALLDLVKAQRPGGFRLWVFESNRPAREFYRRHGLLDLHRTDGAANMEREPDLQMVWPGERPLGLLRSLVDEVDVELGDLLARRVALTQVVQQVKGGGAVGTRDADRERDVAERVAARVPELGPERTARIMDAVITASLDVVGRRER